MAFYSYEVILYGFDGTATVEADQRRLRVQLEAIYAGNLLMFDIFRMPDGSQLRALDSMGVVYEDPGLRNPPLLDAPTLALKKKGACGSISAYMKAFYHYYFNEICRFVLRFVDHGIVMIDGQPKQLSSWHVLLERADGREEDWSRRLGMR